MNYVNAIRLCDKLDEIYSQLRFMNVVLRGALDIMEKEGVNAHEAIRASGNTAAETAHDAFISTLLYLHDQIADIISQYDSTT